MTIIVYKDGKIASDSRACSDDFIISDHIEKIAKGDGIIGGGAGDATQLRVFLQWVKDGGNLQKRPWKKDLTGLVAYKQFKQTPRLIRIEDEEYYEIPLIKGEIASIGSGREVARGAVEAGASLEDAVAIAIKVLNSCGGKVQVLSL